MLNRYAFGPLVVDINGADDLVLEIAKDFDFLGESTKDCKPDIKLTFELENIDISETHYSGKKTLYFNDDEICFNVNQFYTGYVKGLFSEGTTSIRIIQKKQSTEKQFLNFIKRTISLEYSTKQGQLRNQISNYSFLWAIFSIELLEKNCAFLHAGIFTKKEKTVIVAGTGGCGKTSTVINACRELGFHFLSEDFGIVSAKGDTFYCPKTISLYKSDFKYYSSLESEVVGKFNWYERLKWKVLTKVLKRNPIVKVNPHDIFQRNKISKITNVYFFQRLKKDGFTINDIELSLLIDRICWASYREIAPFLTLLCGVTANKDIEQEFNSPEDVRIRMLSVYRSAFSNTHNKLFSCSLKANPLEIMSLIDE
jgi:hypothetical protein